MDRKKNEAMFLIVSKEFEDNQIDFFEYSGDESYIFFFNFWVDNGTEKYLLIQNVVWYDISKQRETNEWKKKTSIKLHHHYVFCLIYLLLLYYFQK